VSHLKERKEKNCLNCGADLIGRYCHVCGQENLEPKETVWHLVSHFFNDITHFDGKFFSTVKYLLRKPGFLSTEYIKGRRMSYLNPIRMYVFTSAFFFIVLFAMKSPSGIVRMNKTNTGGSKTLHALLADQSRLQKQLANEKDEDDQEEIRGNLRDNTVEIAAIKKHYSDTTKKTFSKAELDSLLLKSYSDSLSEGYLSSKDRKSFVRALRNLQPNNEEEGDNYAFFSGDHEYKTVGAYDSSERALPDSLRDGWLKRWFTRRNILINEEYRAEPRLFKEHLEENILHSFPKILFVSLPIFALILNILYFRHKEYYYVDHGIFTIHVYCATFILLLLAILLNRLDNALGWGWFHVISIILTVALSIYMMIYLYKAMRGFYHQRRAKTFLKYCITFFVAALINGILTTIFILISVFST
jgi:Protein of unknown function (DUF3667)